MTIRTWALGVLAWSALSIAACSELFSGGEEGSATRAKLQAADGDAAIWITHGRTYSEQRHSPHGRVNAGTVNQPGLARYRVSAQTFPADNNSVQRG